MVLMDNHDKYVIVLKLMREGSEIELVKSLGYKIILFATELTISELMEVDVPYEIDLNDEDAVLSKAKELSEKYNIVGVFTLNEYRVALAARIRKVLGITYGLSYEAAFRCRNKKETRKILTDNNVNSVKYRLIRSIEEADKALETIHLPVVIKPSNDAGSEMVYCCKTINEVHSAIQSIQECKGNLVGQEIDKEILLEEFLTGPEFSVETYTFNKQTKIIAITAKKVLSPFNPIEVGHTVPARIDADTVKSIEKIIKDSVEAIGIDYSITHIELKLTPMGPKIIEINARPGGDQITTLVEMTTGYNLHEIELLASLGLPIDKAHKREIISSSASIRFLISDSDGIIEFGDQLSVLDNPLVTQVVMYEEDGDLVEKTTSNYNRLGYFIVKGSDSQYSEEIAEGLLSKINIKIKQREVI